MAFARFHVPVLLLVLAPATVLAQAQQAPATPAPAAPAATTAPAATAAPAATGGGGAASDAPAKPKVDATGYGYSDPKPAKRMKVAAPRRTARVSGPIATLPGFEMLADGGSRLFVQLTQNVPVEEKRAKGSITYVLRGAHVAKYNNERPLVTVHFNTPVSSARLLPKGNDLVFVVNLRANASPTYKVDAAKDGGAILTIDFAKGDYVPNAPAPAPAPADNGGDNGGNGGGNADDAQTPKK